MKRQKEFDDETNTLAAGGRGRDDEGNEGLTCMNLYFSTLCMMMGRMTDTREEES